MTMTSGWADDVILTKRLSYKVIVKMTSVWPFWVGYKKFRELIKVISNWELGRGPADFKTEILESIRITIPPDIFASDFIIKVPLHHCSIKKISDYQKSIINGYFDCLKRSLNIVLDAMKIWIRVNPSWSLNFGLVATRWGLEIQTNLIWSGPKKSSPKACTVLSIWTQ